MARSLLSVNRSVSILLPTRLCLALAAAICPWVFAKRQGAWLSMQTSPHSILSGTAPACAMPLDVVLCYALARFGVFCSSAAIAS